VVWGSVFRIKAHAFAHSICAWIGALASSTPPLARQQPLSYLPIADHGVIGDLRTVALVGTDGTIDFMCAPRFDSPTVFASLLDHARGGAFSIEPRLGGARRRQMYLPDTNVLLTRFLAPEGVAEISDFMPIATDGLPSRLVRRVKAVRGAVTIRVRCAPRFGYGQAGHRVVVSGSRAEFQPDTDGIPARLTATVPLSVSGGDAVAEFRLETGESAAFLLELGDLRAPIEHLRAYAAEAFKATENFWRLWIGKSTYRGRWRDEVNRSALALKLLISRKEGSLVAAPTFGLPESIGGVRNWDYRYTWVRDAAFTLYALIRLGLTEETGAFIDWIAERCSGDAPGSGGPLRPLYSLDGQPALAESIITEWEGYRGSTPVRIGNAAAGQLQLDIYGALMDSVYLYDKYGQPISHDFWQRLTTQVEWVCENWRMPDHGIWEIRSTTREHLNSRLLCWVAVDRAVRLAMRRSLPAPITRWIEERDRIYRSIYDDMWHPGRQAFVRDKGSEQMDASVLLMPLLRFIAPTDPRWRSTLRAVEQELVEDSLVRRYRVLGPETDGIHEDEGTFTICSFWYAECLSRAGDLQQARLVFEKVLGYANHLGLFAEQLGASGEHLGNFPQAFTHLALISAAFDIDRRLEGAGWRA
jgi:GH15 family glucan-1,4-alpha-glucosidase